VLSLRLKITNKAVMGRISGVEMRKESRRISVPYSM
jgi:hypothetical protein